MVLDKMVEYKTAHSKLVCYLYCFHTPPKCQLECTIPNTNLFIAKYKTAHSNLVCYLYCFHAPLKGLSVMRAHEEVSRKL